MRSSSRLVLMGAGICLLTVVCTEQAFSQAAIPSISSTLPQGAGPGQTVDVKIRGGNLAGPTQFWASFPVEATLPAEIAGNGTNAGEITYRLKLPPDAPLGVHGLRVATAQGLSNLKLFVVDDLPSLAQVKPNTTMATAQALTLPVAVDGYVDNLSRDYYKFQAVAGQRVTVEVLARRLGSPLDSTIRILDSKGRELAYNDDAPGLGSDSLLSFTFKDAGEYIVEVRDIRYQGNGNFLYRLRLGDFPAVTVPYPMAVQRGASANVSFAGATAQEIPPMPLNIAGDSQLSWLPLGAKLPGGKSSAFAVLSVGGGPEAVEVEPNNAPAQATRVTLGASLNGRIDQARDADCFVFTAKAGQRFVFSGVTRSQGSPSNLFLRLLKADGAEVSAAEGVGPNEGLINYTFPADGDYTLEVTEQTGFGGPEFAYRIAVAPYEEKFELSATTDTINVPLGGLATVTVNAVRNNFGGPITLSLIDPPAGVTATPVVIGPGMTTTTLTIQAATNVPAGKVYPIKIAGSSQAGNVTYQAVATVTAAQKAAFSGLVNPPQFLSQSVALGVNPAPLFVLKTDKPEVVFGKDLSATVKVVAARAEGFGEEIALAVTPAAPAPGLPPGVTAAVKPIAKGTNEIEISFAANAQAPLGQFSVVLLGTGKAGNNTTVQPIPALFLNLKAPFELKADFAGGNLAKGQTLKTKVIATRNPAYGGEIVLTFQNLPKGVTAAAATIPAGQNEVEVVLTAAADAAVGPVNNVVVQGEGKNGNAKLTGASGNTVLTVQ
ncbi:MAG: PPC domain-containing protein [Planctomycetes bacterium]|nr:PPC domain-containing protein [Planctomycetota bacterium]